MTRIERIFADFSLFLSIRANPPDPRSIPEVLEGFLNLLKINLVDHYKPNHAKKASKHTQMKCETAYV